jgi:hypothetical protein
MKNHTRVFDMFIELVTSVFYGFIMVCVYAITNAVVDISDSMRQIKASTEAINHYLSILNREFKIYNSIKHDKTPETTSILTADSF